MKVLIIDDEAKSRSALRAVLEDYCEEVEEINEGSSLEYAVNEIKKNCPDIVFLDVEMPGRDGFRIFDFFDEDQINFQIIFTTTYEQTALEMFEVNAFFYLLKPIEPEKVKETIRRSKKEIEVNDIQRELIQIKNWLKYKKNKIAIPLFDCIRYEKFSKIMLFKASGMYTKVCLKNEEILVSKPLRYFEAQLTNRKEFVRSHRSFIININYVKQFQKKDGLYLIMENGERSAVSKDRNEQLLKALQSA